jgi:arylsulfatase A-like enzyme
MPETRPNIILITTDQQRFDTTGPEAPRFLRTPHLDHLARDGATFSRAYADCPICIPSRVTIMTGRHGFNHGMTSNGALPDGTLPIDPSRSLPARLGALGYQTLAVGKMHFSPQWARYGFDETVLPDDYYHFMRRYGAALGLQQPMEHGLGQNELYPGMATVPEAATLTAWIVDQCVEFIKRRRDPLRPFFLWCSFSKPHPPLDPPEPYYSMYRDAPLPEPWIGEWAALESGRVPESFRRWREGRSFDLLAPETLRAARAAYYGLITQIDYNIGRLFAALEDHHLFDETAFLFTADHGEMLGDHYGGAKQYFYEGSAHIPFILRLPASVDRRPVGATLGQPVCLADVYPTLIAAAGGDATGRGGALGSEAGDGQNLLALSTGQLTHPRPWLEAACGRPQPKWHGLTDGRWKYTYFFEDGIEQLFDLETDPHELTDLAAPAPAATHGAQVERCRTLLMERLERRHSSLVRDGRLAVLGVRDQSVAARRARPGFGYHTAQYAQDTRH